jgi:hypothetical protein
MKWSVLMVAALAHVLGVALRSRLVGASFLLVGNMLLWPSGAIAEIITGPLKASQDFGDDVNNVVAPAFKKITGAKDNTENQSGGLINVATNAFANKNDSGLTWKFNWADAATQALVEASFSGSYNAWVVSAPSDIQAGGKTWRKKDSDGFIARFGKENKNEIGGALFNVTAKYDDKDKFPADNKTDKYSLHWIQAVTGSYHGVNRPTGLDVTKYANGKVPYYDYGDKGGIAGTTDRNNAWFLDTPNVFEDEYEKNPVGTVTFQLVLALEDQKLDKDGKATENNVTLLGGYEWGYTYTAEENPEPASMTLFAIGVAGVMGYAWRRRKQAA